MANQWIIFIYVPKSVIAVAKSHKAGAAIAGCSDAIVLVNDSELKCSVFSVENQYSAVSWRNWNDACYEIAVSAVNAIHCSGWKCPRAIQMSEIDDSGIALSVEGSIGAY